GNVLSIKDRGPTGVVEVKPTVYRHTRPPGCSLGPGYRAVGHADPGRYPTSAGDGVDTCRVRPRGAGRGSLTTKKVLLQRVDEVEVSGDLAGKDRLQPGVVLWGEVRKVEFKSGFIPEGIHRPTATDAVVDTTKSVDGTHNVHVRWREGTEVPCRTKQPFGDRHVLTSAGFVRLSDSQ